MDNVAVIRFNEDQTRYDLIIGGKLKAYTDIDHEAGKQELIRMVKEKGYTIEFEGGPTNEAITK
jgi:hypothetical protein